MRKFDVWQLWEELDTTCVGCVRVMTKRNFALSWKLDQRT